MATDETKTCTKCGEVRLISEFDKQQGGRLGATSHCKFCMRTMARMYREANPDKVREALKQYKTDHPERVREQRQRYYQANREKCIEYSKRYQKDNLEKRRLTKAKLQMFKTKDHP